jgi:hypothetical protein
MKINNRIYIYFYNDYINFRFYNTGKIKLIYLGFILIVLDTEKE